MRGTPFPSRALTAVCVLLAVALLAAPGGSGGWGWPLDLAMDLVRRGVSRS